VDNYLVECERGFPLRGSVDLGKILGIPIRLHLSWFLIAGLITWSLAVGFFPVNYPGWETTTYWLVGLLAAVLFFVSVLLHELGHSVLALREKVPVKSITLFIFGGVAQIGREPPTAGAEFRIAIAGPLTSLGLSAFFGGLGAVLGDGMALGAAFAYLGRVNLLLAVFNMIPGFPLDGGRVFRAALWAWNDDYENATRWAARAGQGVAALFIAFGLGSVIFSGAFNGLWLVFIGWYLNNAARSSYQHARLQKLLTGVQARNAQVERCLPVSGNLQLDRLVDDHVLRDGQRCFVVGESDQARGLITLDSIKSVPSDRRATMTAGQIMTDIASLLQAKPDDDLWNIMQRMGQEELAQVPVVEEDGSFLGLITHESLTNQIRLRSELTV
jgi:Zn-dependent protease